MKILQAAISIDTTGSMYAAADEVRQKAKELGVKLFKSCPGAEIGLIFHGDYCDEGETYVTKKLGLTSDLPTFTNFVKTVGATSGGDLPECYELVLHETRTLGWKSDAKKVLILMGDDVPHTPSYSMNKLKLDWKREAQELSVKGIQVIAVQCLNRPHATSFYEDLARLTGGVHLHLNQFRYVEQIVLGALLHSGDPEALAQFEQELQQKKQYPNEIERAFNTLRGKKFVPTKPRVDGLIPVPSERFQVFEVDVSKKMQSRDFVKGKGIEFKKGNVFYPHVTRPELIQHHKEVVLEDLKTGEMFTGSEARRMIGLTDTNQKLKQNPLAGYRCWIQSTSVNRVLRDPVVLYDMNT